MNFFTSLFNKETDLILKDKVAEFLKTSPEKLDEFEAAYKKAAISDKTDDIFSVSSREASEAVRSQQLPADVDEEKSALLIERIVDELRARTKTLSIADGRTETLAPYALPDNYKPVCELLGH